MTALEKMLRACKLCKALALMILVTGCTDSRDSAIEPPPPTQDIEETLPDTDDEVDEELPLTYRQLMTDRLIDADYWQEEPAILAAGLGFTDINGVAGLGEPGQSLEDIEALVRAAGGGWHVVSSDADPDQVPLRARTSAVSLSGTVISFGFPSPSGDGLPIVFSHPVLASTVQREDILVRLNTGRSVTPDNISVMPNMEYNERSTLVVNGDFGNRLSPDDPGAIFPVQIEVVDELMLVTPHGLFNARGLVFGEGATPLTAYLPGSGPRLCAAKLTLADAGIAGEGGAVGLQDASFPNDVRALYGAEADFRLRVLTTGGFSPNGIRSLYPDEFASFFRVGVRPANVDGSDYDNLIWLTTVDEDVEIPEFGSLRVLGLADLGIKLDHYDDTYIEDHDNQIDIVLAGSRAAAERVAVVHIPASGDYLPFYNPGGPGNSPDPETIYSQPGPEQYQPVTVALEDPMQVSYEP
jgi:hypothetical protein